MKRKNRFITNKKIIGELRSLYERGGNVLLPETVVLAAKNPGSAMHNCFEWNNTAAAQKYRLWQARQLLQVTVEYLAIKGDRKPMRVFVSLKSDRKNDGGYRSTTDVLSDAELRKQLLHDAFEDLERVRLNYHYLKELAVIFSIVKKVRSRLG